MTVEEMKSAMFYDNFIVLDTESTGFQPNNTYSKLLEIGAVKINKGNIVDRYDQIINPGCVIPERIKELTGITNEDVKDKPDIPHALADFKKWCGEKFVIIGHNVIHDIKFLNFFGEQCGILFNEPCIDTQAFSKALFKNGGWNEVGKNLKEGYKLSTLALLFDIKDDNHHRADNDAEVTWQVFQKLKQFAIKKEPTLVYRKWNYPEIAGKKEEKETFILSASPWDTGERLYIRLKQINGEEENFSDIFFDFKKKCWGTKNVNFPVNFIKVENVIQNEYGTKLCDYTSFRQRKYWSNKTI